jgi:hypothetical protein
MWRAPCPSPSSGTLSRIFHPAVSLHHEGNDAPPRAVRVPDIRHPSGVASVACFPCFTPELNLMAKAGPQLAPLSVILRRLRYFARAFRVKFTIESVTCNVISTSFVPIPGPDQISGAPASCKLRSARAELYERGRLNRSIFIIKSQAPEKWTVVGRITVPFLLI